MEANHLGMMLMIAAACMTYRQGACHRARVPCSQDTVCCLLQNMGSSYSQALATLAECTAAAVQGGGPPAAPSEAALANHAHDADQLLDGRAQLSAALLLLHQHGSHSSPCALRPAGILQHAERQQQLAASAVPSAVHDGDGLLILDEWRARDAGLSAAGQLALLASSTDVVVLHHRQ